MLQIGKNAPAFSLPNQDGEKVSLRDLRGFKIVLYFYPKDMTSGCTQEACDFRDELTPLKKLKAIVIGVSADSPASHKKFREKYDLNFDLLSDESKEMLETYGVWKEKSMYGKKYMGIERTTVIIDEFGKVSHIFSKVKVTGHVQEIKKALQAK